MATTFGPRPSRPQRVASRPSREISERHLHFEATAPETESGPDRGLSVFAARQNVASKRSGDGSAASARRLPGRNTWPACWGGDGSLAFGAARGRCGQNGRGPVPALVAGRDDFDTPGLLNCSPGPASFRCRPSKESLCRPATQFLLDRGCAQKVFPPRVKDLSYCMLLGPLKRDTFQVRDIKRVIGFLLPDVRQLCPQSRS